MSKQLPQEDMLAFVADLHRRYEEVGEEMPLMPALLTVIVEKWIREITDYTAGFEVRSQALTILAEKIYLQMQEMFSEFDASMSAEDIEDIAIQVAKEGQDG